MPGTMSTYNSLLLPLSNEVQPTPKLTGTHTEPRDLVWVILHLSPPFGFRAVTVPAILEAAAFLGSPLTLPTPYKWALWWSLPSVSCRNPAALAPLLCCRIHFIMDRLFWGWGRRHFLPGTVHPGHKL